MQVRREKASERTCHECLSFELNDTITDMYGEGNGYCDCVEDIVFCSEFKTNQMKHKIIIAGKRNFDDYNLLKNKVDVYLSKLNKNEIEIITGGATGADALGKRYAKEYGLRWQEFPAEWDKYPPEQRKKAGPIRNKKMAHYARATQDSVGYLIAFWDGKSSGTKSMIELAKKSELKIRIVRI
jgi:hypothetical protein